MATRHARSIEDFLASLDLQEHLPLMEAEGIDLDSLTELSEEDLKEIGMKKMGHRKKLLKEVKRTFSTEAPDVPARTDVSRNENVSPQIDKSLTTSSDDHSSYEKLPPSRLDNEIRIAVVGKTGCGKSATANTILGEKKFSSQPLFSSVTSGCSTANQVRFGKKIVIVDTPGVCDTGRTDEDIQKEIQQCVTITAPGPHAFILVLGISRYTKEENDAVQHFIKYFGEGIYEYFIVLFTRKDDMDRANMTLDDVIKTAPNELQEFIKKCQKRVVAFDNTLKGNEQDKQVRCLLDLINANVLRNSGKHYTHEMYEEAEEIMMKRQKEIEEAEKEEWDKERKKIADEVGKEFQKELNKKQEEIKQIESTMEELKETSCKSDEEAKEMENKVKSLKDKLRKEKEENEKLKQAKEEKEAKMQKHLQAVIDNHTRDESRVEVAKCKGVLDVLYDSGYAAYKFLTFQ